MIYKPLLASIHRRRSGLANSLVALTAQPERVAEHERKCLAFHVAVTRVFSQAIQAAHVARIDKDRAEAENVQVDAAAKHDALVGILVCGTRVLESVILTILLLPRRRTGQREQRHIAFELPRVYRTAG